MSVPNVLSVFAEAVGKRQDLLSQLKALADQGDAGGWPAEVQSAHSALRGKLLRIGAWACHQQDPKWGLLAKSAGSFATRADGKQHATDILFYQTSTEPNIIDCFNDRSPQWGPLEEIRPLVQWIEPIPEEVIPDPPPVPPPSGTSIEDRLEAIERVIRGLKVVTGGFNG